MGTWVPVLSGVYSKDTPLGPLDVVPCRETSRRDPAEDVEDRDPGVGTQGPRGVEWVGPVQEEGRRGRPGSG